MKKTLPFALLLISLFFMGFLQKTPKPPKEDKPETPPSVKLEPGTVDFGDQVAKRHSKPQRIVVTNAGGKKLYINSVVLDGDNKQDFALSGDSCTGATIASGKSCVIDVVFTPYKIDKRKATIVLTDNAPDSQQNIVLIGNGINSVDVPPGSGQR